jgi:hypothetical protein
MSRPHIDPHDPNVQMLEVVAAQLGPEMLRRLVFVGGSIAGLLITDPMLPAIRPTDDIDLVVQVTGRPGFYALEDDLRALGFVNDTRPNAPICRWRCVGIAVDVVPSDKAVLGFANRWYPLGIQTAQAITSPSMRPAFAPQNWKRFLIGAKTAPANPTIWAATTWAISLPS